MSRAPVRLQLRAHAGKGDISLILHEDLEILWDRWKIRPESLPVNLELEIHFLIIKMTFGTSMRDIIQELGGRCAARRKLSKFR